MRTLKQTKHKLFKSGQRKIASAVKRNATALTRMETEMDEIHGMSFSKSSMNEVKIQWDLIRK